MCCDDIGKQYPGIPLQFERPGPNLIELLLLKPQLIPQEETWHAQLKRRRAEVAVAPAQCRPSACLLRRLARRSEHEILHPPQRRSYSPAGRLLVGFDAFPQVPQNVG